MNNRILPASIAGGILNFLLGWVVYGIALMPYYESHSTREAIAVMKNPPDIWAYGLGSLVWALLLAVIYSRWGSISTFRSGASVGAVIGVLASLSFGLNMYAGMNLTTDATAWLVDPLANALVSGLTGGLVGWVLGYKRA